MKRNWIPVLTVAFVVAVVSTGVFYGLIAGRLEPARERANTMVVAARPLKAGETLSAESLREVHAKGIPSGAVSSISEAAGRELAAPVASGAPILYKALAPEPAALAGAIPEGLRAVSVRVSEPAGVASMLGPGARVDVQYIEGPDVAPARRRLRRILENVRVLAAEPAGSVNRSARTVLTLVVPPAAADLLSLADETGNLRVVLRNPSDRSEAPGGPIQHSQIFSGAASAPSAIATPPAVAASRQTAGTLPVGSAAAPAWMPVEVGFLELSPQAWSQMLAGMPVIPGTISLSRLPEGTGLERLVGSAGLPGGVRELFHQSLEARPGRPSVAEYAGRTNGIRVRLEVKAVPPGGLSVVSEVRAPSGQGVFSRRLETRLEDPAGRCYLVAGLEPPGGTEAQQAGRMVAIFRVGSWMERAALAP